jgi:hypothetical protein
MRLPRATAAGLLPLLWFASCTPLDSENDAFAGGAAGTSSQAGKSGGGATGSPAEGGTGTDAAGQTHAPEGGSDAAGGQAGAGGGDAGCPDPDERNVVAIAENGELTLDTDTTWTCGHDYEVRGNVIVAPGSTLSIGAGTTIRFAPETMLLVQRGARIEAVGRFEQPITFTSAKAEGSRAPGDYRGLVLIGDAPSHSATTPVHDSLSDARAHYGGGQAGDPAGSCGKLRYVRIDFAGGSIDDASLPAGALTLAGCGRGTTVDYVQVHRATDGIGILGGTVGLRHVVVSNNFLGEAVEWSKGYSGTMQFIVAQSLGASAAMQGSNSADDAEASPVSRPVIYNASLLGRAPLVTGQHFGFVLQLGSRAVLKNSLIHGFADAAFDLRLEQGVLQNELGPGKSVDISHALLHGNTADYSSSAEALSTMQSMRQQDPGLPSAGYPTPQMPDVTPTFAPTNPTVNTDPAATPGGFDATAGFRGAVPQDGVDWTLGWTHFPKN